MDESLELCRKFCLIAPKVLQRLTVQEAVDMERGGIPFYICVFFYILRCSCDQCSVIGGGLKIGVFLCRLLRFIVEYRVQVLLDSVNFGLSASAFPHKLLRGRVLAELKSCTKCIAKWFTSFLQHCRH